MTTYKLQCSFLSLIFFIGSFQIAAAKKIHNHKYKYKITLPDKLVEIKDSLASVQEQLYLDSTAGLALIISARESSFKSVGDYLDCSKEDLEKQLQFYYSDSTLTLISCIKPSRYPKQTTIVHFFTASSPQEYNTDIIYFIHHKRNDIQFYFTYRKESAQSCEEYINSIMQGLKLR